MSRSSIRSHVRLGDVEIKKMKISNKKTMRTKRKVSAMFEIYQK